MKMEFDACLVASIQIKRTYREVENLLLLLYVQQDDRGIRSLK